MNKSQARRLEWEPDGIVENQLASVANNKSHCDRARLLILLKQHLALHLQPHTPGHCSINMKLLFFVFFGGTIWIQGHFRDTFCFF